MDIRQYLKRSRRDNEDLKKIKTPEKKAKRIVNSVGTTYEDTDYVVCSICIKLFKTHDKYLLHMEDHQKQLSLNKYTIMKVFKCVPEADKVNNPDPELNFNLIEGTQHVAINIPTTSNTVIEKLGEPYVTAQAIIKLGLSETLGDTMKSLASEIKTIDKRINLHGITNLTISIDEFRQAIAAMSNNITELLLKRVLQSPYFTLHLGEFADIQNFTMLIVTIRFKGETQIHDDILFCHRLESSSADEIYLTVSNFIQTYKLDWQNCLGISMDRVRAQCEPLKHFMECIFFSGLAPNLTYTFSRRAAFIEQHLSEILVETLHDAIVIVNILKRDTTLKFESYMDDGYHQILHYTEQHWLSHGRMLSRLFEMRDHYKNLSEIGAYKYKFIDTDWLHKLAYLADIFDFFNRINRDLQNDKYSTFHVYDKITVIIEMLKMYKTNVEKHSYIQFSNLHQLMNNESHRNINPNVVVAILENLRCLQNHMNGYLPIEDCDVENCAWVRNPFDVNSDKMPSNFSVSEKEMLLNLKKDGFIKSKFDEENLDGFWSLAQKKYPDLAVRAMKYLLIFKNSQLSELAFASLVDVRTKMLTDLDNEQSYVRIKLSNIEPEVVTPN